MFSEKEDLSFSHSNLSEKITGREKVFQEYDRIAELFEENGGFLRSDLPTSQVICFSEDGNHAEGEWLTMGFLIEKEPEDESGNLYRNFTMYGQRKTVFVKENGAWKITDISWSEIMRVGPSPYDITKESGWIAKRDRRWELPPTSKTGPWEGRRMKA